MTSLRRRVGVWLLPPLLLLLGINAMLSWRSALDAANLAYDRALRAAVKSISERSTVRDGEIIVDIPYSAFEVFAEGGQERVFHAVIGPGGTLITGYPDLPIPERLPADGQSSTGDAQYKGEAVRLGVFRKRLYDPRRRADDSVLVLVAETIETRTELARELFFDSLRRQLALIGLGSVLVLAALGTAFKPLLRLRDTIRARSSEDLTPVSARDVPSEIRPLIDAINAHVGRIARMLDARKRFLADAAHQLRTPLTVLGTQTEYALRQHDPEEIQLTLRGIHRSIRSAQRLGNQMLSLSSAEAINGLMRERQPVDLAALVRECALEFGPLAVRKTIDLAYDGPAQARPVDGNATMLREAIINVLDNAIRYTPAGGRVTLGVVDAPTQVQIRVCDTGPGVAATEREKVFRRFYRLSDQQHTEGSGLGLAIVKEICLAHGGSVSLGDGESGRGLCVTIAVPVVAGVPPP